MAEPNQEVDAFTHDVTVVGVPSEVTAKNHTEVFYTRARLSRMVPPPTRTLTGEMFRVFCRVPRRISVLDVLSLSPWAWNTRQERSGWTPCVGSGEEGCV